MELVTSGFILAGTIFFLISATGVLRLPDAYARIHAASKASSLGMGLLLIGVFSHFLTFGVFLKCTLILFFIFLTAPISAHILGRAGLLSGAKPWSKTVLDEVKSFYSKHPRSPETREGEILK